MSCPLLEIDELALQLPAEYQQRAAAIAHLIGEELSRLSITESVAVERLVVPPLSVPAGLSDRHLASTVARAIGTHITAPKGPRS